MYHNNQWYIGHKHLHLPEHTHNGYLLTVICNVDNTGNQFLSLFYFFTTLDQGSALSCDHGDSTIPSTVEKRLQAAFMLL